VGPLLDDKNRRGIRDGNCYPAHARNGLFVGFAVLIGQVDHTKGEKDLPQHWS